MYRRSSEGWLKHLDFIILDAICLQLALILAFKLRFPAGNIVYSEPIYLNLAAMMAIFGIAVAVVFNTMKEVLKRPWWTELRQTIVQSTLVLGLIVVYLFSVKDSELYSRIVIWSAIILYTAISFILRVGWKAVLKVHRRTEQKRAILLIAEEVSAGSIIEQFKSHPLENISLCGLILADRDAASEALEDVAIVANMSDAAQYICREWIDEVYIAVTDTDITSYGLIDKCREMGVTVHSQIPVQSSGKQTIERIAGSWVVTNSINIASGGQLLIKRLIDILGGFVLSVFALIAIAIVGPIIKKRSPGPILYSQERIGQNGKRFRMFKIRSMYLDADARKQELMSQNRVADGMMFKLDFDPRIIGNEILPDGTRKTGIGEFIRKYSIDELPQGFNILIGQMSLVGTRPPTVDEWERYELHHRARLAFKPGLTGMWQVSGRSDITDFDEVTRLDTDYIENWNIGLDIKILFKTVWTVLRHKGAM